MVFVGGKLSGVHGYNWDVAEVVTKDWVKVVHA